VPVPQIRSHNFWRYINLYVWMDGRGFKGICLLVHVVYVMCVVGTEAGRPETATDADTRRKQTTHQGNKSPTVFSGHLFWRGGGIPPPPKGLTVSPKDWQIVCSKSFFGGRDNELPLYHGNFLLSDNKHRKLFFIIIFSLVFFLYTGQLLVHFVACCILPDGCKLHIVHIAFVF